MENNTQICVICDGTIRPLTKLFYSINYKGKNLEIPVWFTIPTCENCQTEYLTLEIKSILNKILNE